MSARGYVVRGEYNGEDVYSYGPSEGFGTGCPEIRPMCCWTLDTAAGARAFMRQRGCDSVTIFSVAEDGTETPLPSYEESLAKVESLTAEIASLRGRPAPLTEEESRIWPDIRRLLAEMDDYEARDRYAKKHADDALDKWADSYADAWDGCCAEYMRVREQEVLTLLRNASRGEVPPEVRRWLLCIDCVTDPSAPPSVALGTTTGAQCGRCGAGGVMYGPPEVRAPERPNAFGEALGRMHRPGAIPPEVRAPQTPGPPAGEMAVTVGEELPGFADPVDVPPVLTPEEVRRADKIKRLGETIDSLRAQLRTYDFRGANPVHWRGLLEQLAIAEKALASAPRSE